MDKVTIEDIKRVLDKRYVDLIEKPITSKEELIELVKDIDYDKLNEVLKNSSSRFYELKDYADLAEMYLVISPERTMTEYQIKFSKKESIDIVRNFFYVRYPELLEDFERKLNTSILCEGAKNEYNSGIVSVNLKDEGNTVKELFALMHEFTHSVGIKEDGKTTNVISWKLSELTTLMNELEFMNFLTVSEDSKLSVEAIKHLLYTLSDTKYMGLTILFENDLAKIYENNGKVEFGDIKKYIESIDLETKKGMMFLQTGNIFLKKIVERGNLKYWFQGRYILGELLGSKLFMNENRRSNFVKLCEILGRNNLHYISEENLQELESLDIDILDSKAILHVSEDEKKMYRDSFSKLLNQIMEMEIKKENENLLSSQMINNESLHNYPNNDFHR